MHPRDMFDFSGQVVAITGAARGIGLATARAFARAGAHVALMDRDGPAVHEAAQNLRAEFKDVSQRIEGLELDVTQPLSVRSGVDAVARWHERLDVMINNAGMALRRPTLELTLDEWNQVMEVNLTGVFLCAQAAGRHMVNARRGCIINTASIAAYEGQVGQAAYSASKGGVVGMTLPIARDLSSLGIRVCTIAPGLFLTPMMMSLPAEAQKSLGAQVPFPPRLGQPAEYARLAAFIIENPLLNAEVIRLDGAIRMTAK